MAKRLEKLINRNGVTFDQACQTLHNGPYKSRESDHGSNGPAPQPSLWDRCDRGRFNYA